MRVFTLATLAAFWTKYRDAERPLRDWLKAAKAAEWVTLADVRQAYGSTDQVGRCFVFNIDGGKYRLIVTLAPGRVFVKHVLTHAEYDRSAWKADCC